VQTCGGGEDIQDLLKALDASLDPPPPKVDPERAIEPVDSINTGDSSQSIATQWNNDNADAVRLPYITDFVTEGLSIFHRFSIHFHHSHFPSIHTAKRSLCRLSVGVHRRCLSVDLVNGCPAILPCVSEKFKV
jgi:hypothetical protein